ELHHDLVGTRRLQLEGIDLERFVEVVQHRASDHGSPPAFGWGPRYRPTAKRGSSLARYLALQRGAVPPATLGRGLVRALHERKQSLIRIGAAPDRRVRQDELTEAGVEARRRRPGGGVAEALRLRIRVGIEDRVREGRVAGPEAGAADLVRVCLAGDPVRHVG